MLSWACNVASQSKAGAWIFGLGESVGGLFEGAEVLATAIAEIDQSKAGEGEGVRHWSQSFSVSNGEWVERGPSRSAGERSWLLCGAWAETEAGKQMGDLK